MEIIRKGFAEKIFVSKARLVKKGRWYIDFERFNPDTGETTRHRKDFDLNDIADLEVRERVGERLVKHLDVFVPPSIPKKSAHSEKTDTPTVKEAIELTVSIKQMAKRGRRKNYAACSRRKKDGPWRRTSRQQIIGFFAGCCSNFFAMCGLWS